MALVAVKPVEKKQAVKLSAISGLFRGKVSLDDDNYLSVRALSLREMVGLFIDARDEFIPLYALGLERKLTVQHIGPFLASAPHLVASIIALASDEPENADIVEKNMPATVQLIALAEIWRLSVPDPKKAQELLSEVTALLQKGSEMLEEQAKTQVPASSMTTLPNS